MGGPGSGRRPKARAQMEIPPPYPCFFECGRILRDKLSWKEFTGWEWFTGYGRHPIHFCPDCRRTRATDIARIRDIMNAKPEGYPEVRLEPPSPTMFHPKGTVDRG